MLMKASNRPRVEVPRYEGNINVEELMDRVNDLNKYFEFEEIKDKKKMRYAATKLKGHATIWWDELQIHRETQFMPKDYRLTLIRQLQNLRQKGMNVKEYT